MPQVASDLAQTNWLQSMWPILAAVGGGMVGGPMDLLLALGGGVRGEIGNADANRANQLLDQEIRGIFGGGQKTPGVKDKYSQPGLYDRVTQRIGANAAQSDKDYKNLTQAATRGYGGLAKYAGKEYDNVAGLYDALRSDASVTGGKLARGMSAGLADLARGYDQRRTRALALHEGMGAQEAADIREGYQDYARNNDARLASSGLGGSTVGAAFRLGNEREQNKDLARLNERLRSEKIGLDVGLSGDALSAQERGIYGLNSLEERNLGRSLDLGVMGAGVRGQGLAANLGLQEQGLVSGLNAYANRIANNSSNSMAANTADTGLMSMFMNYLSGQSHDTANNDPWAGLAQWAANKAMPTPEQPQWYDSFLGNAGSSLGYALPGIIAAPFTGGLSLATSGAGLIQNAGSTGGIPKSDRRLKADFRDVDVHDVLAKMRKVKVEKWKYIPRQEERGDHIGPMAQDVKEAFKLGVVQDMTLNPVDMQGILWASVQAMAERIEQLEGEIKKWSDSNTAGRPGQASAKSVERSQKRTSVAAS